MPSYEYECQLCHARIELVQSVENHEVPAVCPSCNLEHTMKRVYKLGKTEDSSSRNPEHDHKE